MLGMRFKKLQLLTLLMLYGLTSFGQYARNFANTNYGGMQSISYNPANLADSRYRFVITPFSFYTDASNNFINLRTPYSQYDVLLDKVPENQLDENGIPIFEKIFLEDKLNENRKRAFATVEAMGPSFMLGLKEKGSVAFTSKTRVFVHLSGINEDLLKIFVEDFDSTAPGYSLTANQLRYINQRNTQKSFGAGALAYQEFAFSYGNILYNKKENFLKGGVSLKFLTGLGAGSISVNELDYELLAVDSIRFRSADMTAKYTSDRYFSDPNRRLNDYFGKEKLGGGIGVDIGVVYEYRPYYQDHYYMMDRRKHEDKTINKYKFKIGAAITDFGRIKFNNAPYTQQINIQADENAVRDWTNFKSVAKFSGSEDIDSFALDLFPKSSVDSSFGMNLPASLNLNFDLNLNSYWYVNASYIQSLQRNKVKSVRKQNVFSAGARYEKRRYEIAGNLVVGRFYNPVLVSAYFRYGPFFIGSDNLGGFFTPKSTNGINVFAGFQFSILHNLIPDEDNDGVSDDKDKCPGVFGSDRAKGCPDADDDRVPDYKDKCPDVFGVRTADGCPDDDEDGVGNPDDKCPTLYGLEENQGCPDSDGDGIFDHQDSCVNESGIAKYNGCPTEQIVEEEEPEVEEEEEVVAEVETPKVTPPVEKEVVKREEPAPEKKVVTDKPLTPTDVVDLMQFDVYDYYLILGVYSNKNLADDLVKRLNNEAGVLTYIYFDESNKYNYVTFGRVTSEEKAREQLEKLQKPSVDALINGHVWWKKVAK